MLELATSIPVLTSIPSPDQSVWYLGPVPIRAYAMIILFGIAVAIYWTDRRYRARGGGEDVTLDVAVVTVIVGIVGARIYHVISSPDAYFGAHGEPLRAFRIWEGGLGIWGGVAFGAVAAYVMLHRRGLRFGAFGDSIAPTLLVAQAIGRWGNYFNQELYGRPTDLPWALEIDRAHLVAGFEAGTTFHPTFLYESLWCFAAAMVLLLLEKRFKLDGGRLILAYVIAYTMGRTWIEMLRIDDAQIVLGLRLNVWTSLILLLCATAAFALYTRYLRTHRELAEIALRSDSQGEKDADGVEKEID